MSQSSFLSIITATHNRPELLKRMVDSVLAQSFQDWELIIIDDSTNDETKRLATDSFSDTRIIYQKNTENFGLARSRNNGFEVANGTWVTHLDDDDTYASSSALEEVHMTLSSTNLPWAFMNIIDQHQNLRTRVEEPGGVYNWTTDFLYGKAVSGDAVHFLQKSFLGENRYHGEHQAQWSLWYELALMSDMKHLPVTVTKQEYLPDGLSSSRTLQTERIYFIQQLRAVIKHVSQWKHIPLILARYLFSFRVMRKIRQKITQSL